MIARLTGTFVEISIDSAIIDVQGVGYHVLVPVGTSGRLRPDDRGHVSLSVHTNVREDAIQLFGFATQKEKTVFQKITTVSGIGPKIALNILSDLSVQEIVNAIQRDDLARFTSISGIGKKTGQRLLLELKNAFSDLGLVTETGEVPRLDSGLIDDLRSALLNLGYKPVIVDNVVEQVAPLASDHDEVEPLLRRALQLLS